MMPGDTPPAAAPRRRYGRWVFVAVGVFVVLWWVAGTEAPGSGVAPDALAETGAPAPPGDGEGSGGSQGGASLDNYELDGGRATRWELPRRLREISGLATTADHGLLAHDDEEGVVYELDPRDGSVVKSFGMADMEDPVADDFEGIAVAEGRLYLVTSAGRLYECPEGAARESVLFRMHATGVGRECEVEGLTYDPGGRELLLMCKDARGGTPADRLAIHRWSVDDMRLSAGSPILIPVVDFARRIGSNRFQPSGIERHPVSGHYFVVAARQAAIAEVTPAGEVLAARRFPAGRHPQVEGIAFAADGALIVADEGGAGRGRLTIYPLRAAP